MNRPRVWTVGPPGHQRAQLVVDHLIRPVNVLSAIFNLEQIKRVFRTRPDVLDHLVAVEPETHQVDGGVELSHEFYAPLFGLLDLGHGFAVRPFAQPGGEAAQADVVVGLGLVEASHSFGLEFCDGEKNNVQFQT